MSRLGMIGIGTYIPGDSALHSLDPRTKLILTAVMVFSIFWADTWWAYLIITLIVIGMVMISRLTFLFILRSLKPVWLILAVTYLFHLLFTQHGETLLSLGPIHIYEGGVFDGAQWTYRIALLVVSTSLLTLTTPPLVLTSGMTRLLHPLTKVGIPAQEIAFMVAIALRFIPLLWQEVERISAAQLSRGAPLHTGSIKLRAKAMGAVVIPLLSSAFKRAEQLSMAMEARGYRGENRRTQFRPLTFSRLDYLVFGLLGAYALAMVGLGGI